MHRQILIACLPWLGLIAAGVCALWLLARFSGARLRPARLQALPSDQVGSVQSLSFVLTLPLFIMVMMFIVQMSQLAIGTIVVHYAAYAAARSAIVWIPAQVMPDEPENAISSYGGLHTNAKANGPISRAAKLACMSISPSHGDGGVSEMHQATALQAMYKALSPSSVENPRIAERIANKAAYSNAHTRIDIHPYARGDQPAPGIYDEDKNLVVLPSPFLGDDKYELITSGSPNPKIGWQDPITLTVYHDFALLPGPARLLGKGGFYKLQASATLGNEGERSMLPYVYQYDEITDH